MPDTRKVTRDFLAACVDQALHREPADLVVRGATVLDVVTGALILSDIAVCGNRIVGVHEDYEGKREIDGRGLIAVPGFIDTHVHVESTLVVPGEFERCVLPHGTTTAICDPHEIANVLGLEGIRYMLDCADALIMDLFVQLSSCVPATPLETSGATLTTNDLLSLAHHPKVLGLAEFMNYPGLFAKDPAVLDKLAAFQGRVIDGHAPLLRGAALNAYLAAGIRNCHETTSADEGREKLQKGMRLLIREGTVSKDLDALSGLLNQRTAAHCAFCTDDRNPLDIAEEGHLDHLIRRAIANGVDPIEVYRTATIAAAEGFGLFDRGIIAPGKRADIVLIDSLESCRVLTTIAAGQVVTDALLDARPLPPVIGHNSVKLAPVSVTAFRVPAERGEGPVIGLRPGQIVTDHLNLTLPLVEGARLPDPANDILKICVFERHGKAGTVGRGFVRGLGIRAGAIASSVGHDSHNICVAGAADADMAFAVNRLIALGGGFIAVHDGAILAELALPVAGLMSDAPAETVRQRLIALRAAVRRLGTTLPEPFLQMAFLALPVIPHLKITDKGLVDVDGFRLL